METYVRCPPPPSGFACHLPLAGEDFMTCGLRQLAYSTVTLFARFRGWSTSVPFATATWYASSCTGTA